MSTTRLRRFTSRDFEVTDQRDVQTISNGLRVAAERFEADAEAARHTATLLREGETFALIADGEPGARAMDALAEQFTRQATDSRRLMLALDEAVNVVLNNDEDAEF